MLVVWSSTALDDLDAIITYVAAENPRAALNIVDRIEQAGEMLGHMATGRAGRVRGTYEKPVSGLPHIITYAIERRADGNERIVILRIIHGARNWREDEWPGN